MWMIFSWNPSSKIFFLAVVSDFGQKMHSAGTRNKPNDFNLNHDYKHFFKNILLQVKHKEEKNYTEQINK